MVAIDCPRVVEVGDRLHQPLMNLLLFMTAMISAIERVTGKLANNQPRKDGDVISSLSRVAGRQIILPAYGPLERALAGEPSLGIPIVLRSGFPDGDIRDMAKLPGYLETMLASIFLHHYELCSAWLTDNKKGDTTFWPMPLKFGRVIRNALAHNGRIKIDRRAGQPPPDPVTWHSLSYSMADNGRMILGTDLYGADLIALMFEVDDATISLGAPN